VARAAALALLATLALAPAAAAAGWGRPFRLAQPVALDVTDADVAFAPTGASTLSYTVQNADDPATAKAFTVARSARGTLSKPKQLKGVQQVLDLAYDAQGLELLAGTSAKGQDCCSTAETLRWTGGRVGSPHKLVGGLAGPALGRLLTLPDRLVAAVATERGVWVSQSSKADRFGSARRLTPSSALPESLDATTLSGGRSVFVWTARPDPASLAPTQIFLSSGSQKLAPHSARAVITVPGDHRIDELAVARGPSSPTVAWVESWFDATGAYHSQVFAADIRATARPRPLSTPGELAAGLSFAADAQGDQALSWKGCTALGTCEVRAVHRAARGRFSAVAQLGGIDSSQTPAVAISTRGLTALVWVAQGHVIASEAGRTASGFARPRLVSATNFAADITLAFGPKTQALAAWTQGTLNQSVVGASLTSR
jgi:hypothetical protein